MIGHDERRLRRTEKGRIRHQPCWTCAWRRTSPCLCRIRVVQSPIRHSAWPNVSRRVRRRRCLSRQHFPAFNPAANVADLSRSRSHGIRERPPASRSNSRTSVRVVRRQLCFPERGSNRRLSFLPKNSVSAKINLLLNY